MKLYIANCTKQVKDFAYRLKLDPTIRTQRIDIGGQAMIHSEGLTQADIDYIVQKQARYGLVAASSIDQTKPFIGMCYAVDTPVKVNRIAQALEHNDDVLTKRGVEIRKEAAVALHQELSQQHSGLKAVEVEVAEADKDGKVAADAPRERILVDSDPGRHDRSDGRKSRKKKRS